MSTMAQHAQHTPTRQKLDGTRTGRTHRFVVAGHKVFLTVGEFADGRPGEIFIRMSKVGSTMNGLLDAFAIAVSVALQYGAPLEVLTALFKGRAFEPAGVAAGHDQIRDAESIVDYIFRYLEITYRR